MLLRPSYRIITRPADAPRASLWWIWLYTIGILIFTSLVGYAAQAWT